jgi:hypothetical protein
MGAFDTFVRTLRNDNQEGKMNDLIVFAVGMVVTMLVVFGVFSRVPMGMHESKSAAAESDR